MKLNICGRRGGTAAGKRSMTETRPRTLLELYASPQFKRGYARAWLTELQTQVRHRASDHVVAICAREYCAALGRTGERTTAATRGGVQPASHSQKMRPRS
jgi:hypothetical protein